MICPLDPITHPLACLRTGFCFVIYLFMDYRCCCCCSDEKNTHCHEPLILLRSSDQLATSETKGKLKNMDSESLLRNDDEVCKSPSARVNDHKNDRRTTPWLEFATLATVLLTCASLGAFFTNQPSKPLFVLERGQLEVVGASSMDTLTSNTAATTTATTTGRTTTTTTTTSSSPEHDMALWDVGKKIHPPHPKKLHHGEVLYTTVQDPDVGRYYKREFLIPCGYGLLVFNIGPADQAMPYQFDVYDDGYVYSDNGGLCWLYPSYRAHQNDTEPFWNPTDATSFRVPLSQEPLDMTKISTRINEHPHTKAMNEKIQKHGGDYLVMAKHNFYTPHYYRALKAVVNSWKVGEETTTDPDLDALVEQTLEEYMFGKHADPQV